MLSASLPLVDASNSSMADTERQLREVRPTASNISQLREMMDRTRQQRRQWMKAEQPDATTVLKRWPRLLDVNEVVCIQKYYA